MIIAVLGSQGQLGRDLVPRLPGRVVPLTRADIDLAKPDTIPAAIASAKPDVLVNCAAYNFVDQAETEPDAAMAVNAWGVRSLALACRDANVKLVHFSTDYVFGLWEGEAPAEPRSRTGSAGASPSRLHGFTETDAPGPVSVYGISKLAGEYAALAADPRHLVIRTCGLYGVWGSGGKGGNFVETMLKIAGDGKPLKVVNDQFCTPSYTADVAVATVGLIQADRSGLFHVTNAGAPSWFEFASGIFELAGVKAGLTATTSAEFKRPAKRPPYSVLSNARLAAAGVTAPRPWREALAAYLEERKRKPVSA